jgi:hypothetical protein
MVELVLVGPPVDERVAAAASIVGAEEADP